MPSKVGNLLGDFMRGVREPDLPEAVRLGLHNHRLVDRFTDHHPLVIESRALFSPQRRRFAGVALDVLFDHFLIRHWSRFHDTPLAQAIDKDYRLLRRRRPDAGNHARHHRAHRRARLVRALRGAGERGPP